MDMASVFAEITKTAPQADGSIFVYGKATGSDLDLDGQRCDPVWLQQAMPEFMKIGNIREQHDSKRAVGKAIDHELKDSGHWIKARIVDPVAVAKTQAGIFTGFSIGIKGPRLEKSTDAPNGLISGGNICEISLVDRPCLPTATLTVCKAAKPGMSLRASDFDAQRMLVRVEELVEKSTDVDHLEAPAPGQTCADCGAAGHLKCADAPELRVTLGDRLGQDTFDALNAKLGDGANFADAVKEVVEDRLPDQDGFGIAESAKVFDREAAKALVAALMKADGGALPPAYGPEQGDIKNAQAAIGIIAQLIISEASEMCDNPAEDVDIELLMQAVQSLRCFQHREQQQAMGADVVNEATVMLGAEPYAVKGSKEPYGDVSYADPGYQDDKKKRYPLDSKEHARAAWDYINKSENAGKYSSAQLTGIKSRIKAACKKFGVEVDAEKGVTMADIEVDTAPEELDKAVSELEADEVQKVADEVPADVEDVADEVEKTDEPDTTKAAVEEDTDGESLVKALSAALEKADSPLRKSFEAIVEAATETTAKSVSDLSERLVKVEQMAVPGGPALRRTEAERATARRKDLVVEAARLKSLAQVSDDPILRRGYATKAAQLEAEVKAL